MVYITPTENQVSPGWNQSAPAHLPASNLTRILVIGETETDFQTVQQTAQGIAESKLLFDYIIYSDGIEEAVKHSSYDICLIYQHLAWGTEFQQKPTLLQRISLPVIMITGKARSHIEAAAIQNGATDCLAEDELTPALLQRSIHYALEKSRFKEALNRIDFLEEQLSQSQKMEAVGQLAVGVAHDFNNLLTAIMGYSQLMLKEISKTHPHYPDLYQIKQAGERAASLTEQILSFSRKHSQEPKLLNLNTILLNMENLLQHIIGENIDWVAHFTPNLYKIKADPTQIEQVILNLVINARDAMPQGGNLVVQTQNIDLEKSPELGGSYPLPAGPYVMLSISDTGPGIDAETQQHIFEPFFTTKPSGKGTGLGLATVHRIVSQAGGIINVDTSVPQGATFNILLPAIRRPQPPKIKKVNHTISTHLNGKEANRSETILLVEDEQTVRSLAAQALQRQGYRIITAANGDEAIELYRCYRDEIQLLITDVILPGIDGRELAQRLRAETPDLAILYTSGYPSDIIFPNKVLEKDYIFLQKPFSPENLFRSVRLSLDTST